MKQLFALLVAVLFSAGAQAQTVDLSKPAPGQPTNDLTVKKSNAQLLQESKAKDPTQVSDEELSEKYKADVKNPSGTSRVFVPATATTPGGNNPGGMMNSNTTQQNIGNLKTNSTLIYDDAGKVRGNSTSINLGGK